MSTDPVQSEPERARTDERASQVYVSSISAHEFLLGKILAGMVVGLGQWLLALGLLFTLFGLRFAGDPTPLFVTSLLFLFCVVSFGSLVGAAIPNQAAAVQAVALAGFLLSFLRALLVLAACACCVLTGIGLGTFISTFARSANQTQLISFFVNPPLAMLSGALTPIEAMPKWVQPWTLLNPIAHFAAIARNALLVGVSAWRFRRQLS